MRVARRYLIRGRVQGVGFRYFAQAAASREGVHGWVRNLSDGSVEISAEAERDEIDRFEKQIRRGPPGSRVSEVESTDVTATGDGSGFHIR